MIPVSRLVGVFGFFVLCLLGIPNAAVAEVCYKVISAEQKKARMLCVNILDHSASDSFEPFSLNLKTQAQFTALSKFLELDTRQNEANGPAQNFCAPDAGASSFPGPALARTLKALASLPSDERPAKVAITRALVHGKVDLSGALLPFELEITDSIFCGPVIINGTQFSRDVSITDSIVLMGRDDQRYGVISGQAVRVAGNLRLNKIRAALVSLPRARVNGLIGIADSHLGMVSLNEGHAHRLVLRGTHVDSNPIRHISDLMKMKREDQQQHPDYDPLMSAVAEYPFLYNMVDLVDARIVGEFYADDLVTDGPIAGQHAEIGNLRLRQATVHAMDFRSARVGRDVDLRGIEVKLSNVSPGCVFDLVYKWKGNFVAFTHARIGGSVILRHNRLPNNDTDALAARACIPEICLNEMDVFNDIDLSGLNADRLNLSGTDVGGAVELADEFNHAKIQNALDLSQVVSRWLRLADDQMLPSDTTFAGATFGRLDVIEGDLAENLIAVLKPLSDTTETTASYSSIAATLTQMEETAAAARVRIAREDRLTAQASPLIKAWRRVQFILGGYGYAPMNTLLSALTATVVGAFFALLSTHVRIFLGSLQRKDSPSTLIGYITKVVWMFFDALVFSFDRLIPLVSINGQHKDISFEGEPWIRAYFVAHTIFGYLLAAAVLKMVSQAIGIGTG